MERADRVSRRPRTGLLLAYLAAAAGGCDPGVSDNRYGPGDTGAPCNLGSDCRSNACSGGVCLDACTAGTAGCSQHASCALNGEAAPTCTCRDGFFGDGRVCIALDAPKRISTGYGASCAIASDGRLSCWGDNRQGQLGNGVMAESVNPTLVDPNGRAWLAIENAKDGKSCGIRDDHSLWCWGSGLPAPSQVAGDNQWFALVPGLPGCALTRDGSLACAAKTPLPDHVTGEHWRSMSSNGDMTYGLRLDGTLSTWRHGKEPFQPFGVWKAAAVGSSYACAIEDTGQLDCWNGLPDDGLGVTVNAGPDNSPFEDVVAGDFHTCALTRNGALFCWGRNEHGQVGDGTTAFVSQPVRIGAGMPWKAVAAGGSNTCALTKDDRVMCWGDNATGQIGDGTTGGIADGKKPTQIGAGTAWSAVSTGFCDACATDVNGNLSCWGSGDPTAATPATTLPKPIKGAKPWTSVASGADYRCGLQSDGRLWCWGKNNDCGQLGTGDSAAQAEPTLVTGNAQWRTFAVTVRSHDSAAWDTCGVRLDGSLWCWGAKAWWDPNGAPCTLDPEAAPVAPGWQAIALGDRHLCGIDAGGDVACVGSNMHGELGNGGTVDAAMLTPVSGAAHWSRVSAAGNATCAIRDDGTLFCWGDPFAHDKQHLVPESVSAAGAWREVSLGVMHACAIDQAGNLGCWGINLENALGSDTAYEVTTPVTISAAGPWASVSAGSCYSVSAGYGNFSCAVKADKTLWCWGDNHAGEIGDDSLWRSSPTAVVGLP